MSTAKRRLRPYFDVSFALAALIAVPAQLAAQGATPPTLLQVEVRDSIGLPLPDATIEIFTFIEGGVVMEWVPVEPSQIPAGIALLRFSHSGYRSAVFSVPLRDDGKVSLRVSLNPVRDSTKAADPFEARPVRAIGLALEGRAKTDVIGSRRVLTPGDLEQTGVTTLGSLMHRARNTDMNVIPARNATYYVYGRRTGTGYCQPAVMINGDRRRVLPFSTVDGLHRASEVEALEIFTRGPTVPFSYATQSSSCGVMVLWLKNP